ncbi:hypothetical protein HJG54_30900 [Leptolyngbya sp. NK1-12]|uniref:Uncharacterized protein n=1 Tax=Leptolyngbya sp. NK1-12 TaxID=2547451 RepID=A0AA97AK25_9CYAN|nr:hypothetical protein [Leptolyngbya sp. NK1-12]WNZ27299.1 hypothetical protein HJG54_30900 [Leptolyngbya sp. NK1-12]
MQKVYILSDEFNYSKMITYDAGPLYADQMGWKTSSIKAIAPQVNQINIIDPRITESECYYLETLNLEKINSIFFFRIVDPYYEQCNNHWYYKFLVKIKDKQNVYFLSPYQPEEFTKDLDDATNNEKLLVIPYAFKTRCHINSNLKIRKNKIILSGAIGSLFYPYRQKFLDKVGRNILLRHRIELLEHPGYPDIGQKQRHDYIGTKYIEHLSRFRFMFVSPSRCSLEFLKYTECAHARCVPVGKAPRSFSLNQKNTFIELDFNHLFQSTSRLFSIPLSELQNIAEQYYQVMKVERDPDLLNSKLDSFIASQCLL